MIALIDYGAGNLTSVRKALSVVGADIATPAAPDDLRVARAIVVPGVGHFGATAVLGAPWRERILAAVAHGTPLLGICLGLQWLFQGSEESPDLPGLGVLEGRCRLLRPEPAAPRVNEPRPGPAEPRLKVPHVGWNALEQVRPSRLLAGIPNGAQAYFTHSYVAPVTEASVATTTHGVRFASVVERGDVFGAQFHPEKSGEVGLAMLRNFMALIER